MVSAIAGCVNGLYGVTSKSSDAVKENCLARVEWFPVTSQTHTQRDFTDKFKISIMIVIYVAIPDNPCITAISSNF